MVEVSTTAKSDMPMAFIDLQAQRRRLGMRIEKAIARVLEHRQYILGPEGKTLEQQLASHTGARRAIGCANGTDALVLALLALAVGPGDAVLCPSFTFAATAEAVALVGATPIFCRNCSGHLQHRSEEPRSCFCHGQKGSGSQARGRDRG
jgi:histidinol-phosphate/aromatic aminotransferase/cobyric acid decarboxylase-like protein